MKKATIILVVVLIILLSLPVILKPIVLSIAKKQLSAVFKDSVVSIQDCRLGSVHLSLFGVDIKRGPLYHFVIDEIRISYRPRSLIKGKIHRIALRGLTVDINTPQKKISQFISFLNLNTAKPPPFAVNKLSLLDAKLKIHSNDLSLSGVASLGVDLPEQSLDFAAFKADSLEANAINARNISLGVVRNSKEGSFYLNQVRSDKIKMRDIGGSVLLSENKLILLLHSAKLLGGTLQGSLGLTLDKEARYDLQIQAQGVDLAVIASDFKLAEKIQMSGALKGSLNLAGQGLKVELLSGDFSAIDPGGTLVITDKGFLEYLAKNAGQSLEIIADSFKDYHYNSGIVQLGLDKGSLVLSAVLDGEKGKRDLTVVVHDFRLGDYLK